MKRYIQSKLKKWLGIYYIIKRVDELQDLFYLIQADIRLMKQEATNDK